MKRLLSVISVLGLTSISATTAIAMGSTGQTIVSATDISGLFSNKNMDPCNVDNQWKDQDILQFLYQQVKDGSYAHVINDLTIGSRDGSTTITIPIGVKSNCTEYTGSFNITYTITNKKDIGDDLQTTTLYSTNAASAFLSNPSKSKIIDRIQYLNSNIQANQIDVADNSFSYDSSTDLFQAKIVPQAWSSVYTGEVWVYWKSALVVQIGAWPSVVNYGYGSTEVQLSLNRTIDGSVTYKFDDDTTDKDGFKIVGNKLQLKSNLDGNTYACNVVAEISGDTNFGSGRTPLKSTSVIVEGQLVDPKMTSNSSNGFVSSASTSQNTTLQPWRAFNGVKNQQADYWCGTSYGNDWIQIQLPTAKKVTFYQLTSMFYKSATDWTDTNFKTWQLWGSNDSSFASYTLLDSQTNITWNAYPETKTFNISTPGTFLYYRIRITACQAKHGDYTTVAEIEYFGY